MAQSIREIVLDTETTGFDPTTGDKLIEIGAIELINHTPTGKTYHQYINPERAIPRAVSQMHGLTRKYLKNFPTFSEIAQNFMEFVGDDSILVTHMSSFDMAFINQELQNLGYTGYEDSRVIDTLQLARQKFPEQRNSLSALCRRFNIDDSNRNLKGTLLDAQLLTEVYLKLLEDEQD